MFGRPGNHNLDSIISGMNQIGHYADAIHSGERNLPISPCFEEVLIRKSVKLADRREKAPEVYHLWNNWSFNSGRKSIFIIFSDFSSSLIFSTSSLSTSYFFFFFVVFLKINHNYSTRKYNFVKS